MLRAVLFGTAALLLVVSAAEARRGGALLDKKDALTDKDDGYQPGSGIDKLKNADFLFKFIAGNKCKVYDVKLAKGDKVVISLRSKDFDCVLVVESSKKVVLGFNDDDPKNTSGHFLDSRLEFTAPENDTYRVIATSLDKKTGNFQVLVEKAK
jgi:hypothetical protein